MRNSLYYYQVKDKSTTRFGQSFMAFLENLNFIRNISYHTVFVLGSLVSVSSLPVQNESKLWILVAFGYTCTKEMLSTFVLWFTIPHYLVWRLNPEFHIHQTFLKKSKVSWLWKCILSNNFRPNIWLFSVLCTYLCCPCPSKNRVIDVVFNTYCQILLGM